MAKAKISVTIDEGLVDEIDNLGTTRSEVVEAAVRSWLYSRRKAGIEEQTRAYYMSRGREEIIEDGDWAALGVEAMKNWSE